MNRRIGIGIVSAAVLIAVGLLGIGLSGAAVIASPPAVPDTPEAAQIKATVQRAYAIEAEVGKNFDLARLSSVYVNDPRGGALPDIWLNFVHDKWRETGDPRLNDTTYTPGYLDYKLAYFGWWKQGAEKLEVLHTQADREHRHLTVEEIKSVTDAAGRIPPARGAADITPPQITFESISFNGDTAVAVVNDGPRTMELTLVKAANGKWFIAGAKIQSIHF
jgi:hypothetical protein